MQAQISQQANNGRRNEGKGQGGYVAILHKLEEMFYGPGMDVSFSSLKILLYIRHRALRDWRETKAIGKAEIMAATGLKKRCIEKCLHELEIKKHLLVTRTKIGNQNSENIYALHPETYGTDYIYRPEKPSFKLIYGSKGHKSNPQKTMPSCDAAAVPSHGAAGVPTREEAGTPPKNMILKGNSPSKNPFKEPIKKTLSEIGKSELLSDGEREQERKAAEEAKAAIKAIFGGTFRSMVKVDYESYSD